MRRKTAIGAFAVVIMVLATLYPAGTYDVVGAARQP